jgi:hypothetical protein
MLAFEWTLKSKLHSCSVCGPPTIFLTSKISWFNVPDLSPIKLKMGLQKGERLPMATHLYQPSNLDNQQQVVLGTVTFGSQSILVKNARPKPFCWAKPSCFAFSSSKICCTVHEWSCSYNYLLAILRRRHHTFDSKRVRSIQGNIRRHKTSSFSLPLLIRISIKV